MRLGQLARKLALRPTEIVEFLAENQIQIGEGANVRLDHDQVTLIMKKFVPGWEEAKVEVAEALDEISETTKEENEEYPVQVSPELVDPEFVPSIENIEIIKAPKIELAGLKVLGKIELPEPKKKETPPESEVAEPAAAEVEKKTFTEKKPFRTERNKIEENRRRDNRPQKNPVTLQREKEAKEEQRRREEQIARDKEKKTQNYLKKVKTPPTVKAVRLVKEPVMQMTAQELAEPPKTLWGKIVRWLTKAS